MSQHAGLMFRQAARFDIALPARIRVAPAHQGDVRFTPLTGARDGWLSVDLVDFSAGGVGFISSVFIPRRCLLEIRVYGVGSRGHAQEVPLVEGLARAQRTVMTDRRPAYLVGTAFEQPSPALRDQIETVLALLEGHGVSED